MSAIDLKGLSSILPLGWADTVASRLNGDFTAKYIRMVVAGTRWNTRIADEVVKLAEEHKQKLEDIEARVDAMLTSSPTSKPVPA